MRNKIITMALALTVSMSGIPFAGSVQADAFENEAIVTDAVDSQSQDTDLTAETDSEEKPLPMRLKPVKSIHRKPLWKQTEKNSPLRLMLL